MAQTHIRLYIHIIFSTKNRHRFLLPDIEEELFAYIGGILRNHDCVLIAAGGTADHVHLLISLNKHQLVPDIAASVKRDSSKWLKAQGVRYSKFSWQDGYSAFSVGHTQIADVSRYIGNQKAHHQKTPFEAEMRAFFHKYEIDFDESLAWG